MAEPKSENGFDRELSQRLATLREQGLHRELRRVDSAQGARIEINGAPLLNFSSNDYLGLADHPALKVAAAQAVEKFGTGSGASRLVCGSLAPHHELEEMLAAFKGTQAALSFSTGYSAAIGAICALLDKDDVIIIDKLVHASIVDAARLCGAKMRVFDHNDLNDLEDILKWMDSRRENWGAGLNLPDMPKLELEAPRTLIVTESVFSMDGDQAPLREIAALKEKYGAWLMVDEAHATGLYGPRRRGLAEELGVSDRIEIQMGTLGKALGASGGYICGSRALIDYLINRARSFVFSTAPVPAAAAAAAAGVRLAQSEEGAARLESLWGLVSLFHASSSVPQASSKSAIVPFVIGDEIKTVEAAAALLSQGIYVPAIRYPTVARGSARLRITFSAAHSGEDMIALIDGMEQINQRKS